MHCGLFSIEQHILPIHALSQIDYRHTKHYWDCREVCCATMSDIHIYVRRIELSKERRNSNFQSIYFVNKLGEIFSFIHCHVAWRICGLQGGSGEIQKRADQGQQLSHDLACKYYREDIWYSHSSVAWLLCARFILKAVQALIHTTGGPSVLCMISGLKRH